MNEEKDQVFAFSVSKKNTRNQRKTCVHKSKDLEICNLSVTTVSKNRLVVRTLPQCDAETPTP